MIRRSFCPRAEGRDVYMFWFLCVFLPHKKQCNGYKAQKQTIRHQQDGLE